MVYVGIDLHRRSSHVAAFDEGGLELLSRRVTNYPDALRAIFAELGGDARAALEAVLVGSGCQTCLRLSGSSSILLIRGHTRAIAAARVKTDSVDACTLAHMLRADLLPEAYVAPARAP